ncbi:MAG: acyl carrier protein [Candidatus Fermentibacteraceae bacterium]|nr:acyl carrier protein [Candidatus Fermentibacteraceae bacterium]
MKNIVLEYIVDEYLDEDEEDEVSFDSPLISSGIVDSFSMVSLKRFIENKYSIKLSDEEATPEAFDTVNSICDLVNKHVG